MLYNNGTLDHIQMLLSCVNLTGSYFNNDMVTIVNYASQTKLDI